mgnify:CR=1 FL=1
MRLLWRRPSVAHGTLGAMPGPQTNMLDVDFDRVLEVFKAHDVGFFLYIGGTDSAESPATTAGTTVMQTEEGYRARPPGT